MPAIKKRKAKNTKFVIDSCDDCDGKGYEEVGSCDRGCCGPYRYVKCGECKGFGKVKNKYKLVISRNWIRL